MREESWAGPRWSGWGIDLNNTRYQPGTQAKLQEADLDQLELKWVFGFAGSATIGSQPAVVGKRVFIGSPEHRLYVLDAESGCSYWRFDVRGAIRGVPSVAKTDEGPTVFTADRSGWAYAIDANTGVLRWERRVDVHPATMITASPVVHENRVYLSVSSFEETSAWAPTYECCTFRGSVVALAALTGEVVWKTYLIPESAELTGRSPYGVPTYGPSGAGVWSPITIDVERGHLYATTGDAYSRPASANSDAVVALSVDTGAIVWSWQATAGDAYTNACLDPDVHPDVLAECGPDLDFGASAILRALPDGNDILLAGQKSGVLHALSPDSGEVLWQKRLSPGGILGGIEWGMSADERTVYVPLSDVWENMEQQGAAGGVVAVDFVTQESRWKNRAPTLDCLDTIGCVAGQPQASTLIPGLLFSGSMDGHMRVYRTIDGKVVWDYDTNRDYETVNSVKAKGGSLNGGGVTVVNGWVYFTSGYGAFGMPGNVLLAFGPSHP
jgi:polyvinyl alcohol dehydrogenase (cytochrome)